jgi:hypothetical protein
MPSYRLAGIPMDHVQAEVAAFPLASEAALSLHPTVLDAGLSGATETLWRRTETALLGRFPSFSLDEVVAIRDRFWFSRRSPMPLHRYVRQLAKTFLEVSGSQAIPRLPEQEEIEGTDYPARTATARRAWLWMSFAIPPDLLLAALGTRAAGPDRIELVSPVLDRHLQESGFAETHLHVGAALEFSQLWSLAMAAVSDDALKADAFRAPGAELEEGRDLAPWLLRAAMVRYVLAGFLSQADGTTKFATWFRTSFYRAIVRETGAAGFALAQKALSELKQGKLNLRGLYFPMLQKLYTQVSGANARGVAILDRSLRADPLARWFPDRTERNPDVRLVAHALEWLERENDPTFALLFWQMVRVRCLFYRHVVQRPMTPGLQWFVRFYGRSGPARRRLPVEAQLEIAARLGGAGRGLRSLEFRTSPIPNIGELHDYVHRVDDVALSWNGPAPLQQKVLISILARRDRFRRLGISSQGSRIGMRQSFRDRVAVAASLNNELELGLVFHFTRQRGGGAEQGRPKAYWRGSHGDPTLSGKLGNPTFYRYARFFCGKRAEAIALAWLLRHFPASLAVVRGVDVCTDELGIPTWVLRPVLDRVRAASHAAAVTLRRFTGHRVQPLRTTVHAGEDFVHLLSGLRRVDETIEQLKLREGDRIGHGLALGVDACDWANRAGRLVMPREERLWDLVWEWGCYGRQECYPVSGRHDYVEYEIARLSERIFGRTQSPRTMERLQQQLCDSNRLYAAGFPDGTRGTHRVDPALEFLRAYLTQREWFDNGRQGFWLDPAAEGEALASLQAALRRKLGSRGIAVEVNPTSNLLIGDLSDLTKHPLWRLRPPRGGGDAPPVSICIGSDDPLVFGSNLRQEYQFLGDAMAMAGLSDEEIRQWLDRSRACGLESRFTLPRRSCGTLGSVIDTRPSPSQSFL